MGRSPVRPLSAALAWALRGALRVAAGSCIVALVLAMTFSGETAERFATAAYLTAIFAGVGLVIQHFLPAVASEPESSSAATFPSLFGYSIGIVIFLTVVAAAASQPGGEVLAFVACGAAIIVAVLVRVGTIAAPTIVACASFASCAALIAASGGQPFDEPFAITAYVAAVCATFAVLVECWRLRA